MRVTSRLLRALIPLVIAVSIGAFVGYRYVRSSGEPRYEVTAVRKGDLTQQVMATGTLNPLVTLEIGTQVSGTVKELYVDNNSPVKKGQLLALIDPEILEAQLVQAEANLALEKALLEKIDAQFKEDDLNLKNANALLEGGANVSKSDLDAAETAYNLTRAQQNSTVALG
jgi:HlyD family secretion protein